MSERHEASKLTLLRPDIWDQAMTLAVGLTGCVYVPKLPLADGTIYACGGGYYVPPRRDGWGPADESDLRERLRKSRDRLLREISHRGTTKYHPDQWREYIRQQEEAIRQEEEQEKKNAPERTHEPERQEEDTSYVDWAEKQSLAGATGSHVIAVPPGAMEWLLHEVGHWLAASPEERACVNYGLSASETGDDGEREVQAWAFEEIVLAPYGPGRMFAPPSQRDGAAFNKQGPLPQTHMRHIERRIAEMRIDVEQWRSVYVEWIRFERGLPTPSWQRLS